MVYRPCIEQLLYGGSDAVGKTDVCIPAGCPVQDMSEPNLLSLVINKMPKTRMECPHASHS